MNNTVPPLVLNSSLKCNGCGALLLFVPGSGNLKCDHCGVSNPITTDQNASTIKSFDYQLFVDRIDQNKKSDDLKMVKCSSCGSETVLSAFTTSDRCSFCTAPLVLSPQNGQQYVSPHYILPFEISKEQATYFFQNWLNKLWWTPSDLIKQVNSSTSSIQGVYLPHWSFDTTTTSAYTGNRGDYYYTTENYTVTTENGKTENRTRQVRHTRWTEVTGEVENIFNDLMVPASKSLPHKTLKELSPWNFDLLLKFDERYMSGFRSEAYQISPEQGFSLASDQTKNSIRFTIQAKIGGDEQQISGFYTDFNKKAIKYIMLPVWVSAYVYNKKIYQFTINASTGEVIGERPLSWAKIILFVFMVLILVCLVVLMV